MWSKFANLTPALEKPLAYLEQFDLSVDFTLSEVFIWKTIDNTLVMSEHDKKEYDFLLNLILHEVFVTGTVDKIHLLVISENEVELLSNVLPWTLIAFAKQHVILLLGTVKLWAIDLLTDFEIEIESEFEDLQIKGCSEPFNFRKLVSKGNIISNYIKSSRFT